jgi:hypothetical protein
MEEQVVSQAVDVEFIGVVCFLAGLGFGMFVYIVVDWSNAVMRRR